MTFLHIQRQIKIIIRKKSNIKKTTVTFPLVTVTSGFTMSFTDGCGTDRGTGDDFITLVSLVSVTVLAKLRVATSQIMVITQRLPENKFRYRTKYRL